MAGIRKSLADAVRKLATKTSVEQLRKQGVKEVSVIGLDRIVQFVEEAVHRSLRNRLLLGEREAVADATREEFMKLLRSNEELKARGDRAAEEAESLRLELQRSRQELELRLARNDADERAGWEAQDALIRDLVRTVMTASQRERESPQDMERRVLELVMNLVGDERRTTAEAKAAARDNEVELLRRRINKLSQSLEVAEDRIGKLSTLKDVDDGIASVYRDVQGLEPESGNDRKKELMAGIFAANLKLQKKV